MTFKIGDKVRANGREATLTGYDELADRLAYAVQEKGGAVNTFHGHISTTRLEHVPVEDDDDLTPLFDALSTIDSSEEAPVLTVVPKHEPVKAKVETKPFGHGSSENDK